MRRNSVLVITSLAVLFAGAIVVRATRPRSADPAPVAPPPPPSAAPLGRVVVGVYDEGAPLAGRWVVFHDREGRVLSRAKSAADGKVTGEVPAGGMVTVAHGESIHHLVSVVDVQPNDELVIGEKDEEETVAHSVGTVSVRLPGKHPGAARYVVSLGVGPTNIEPGKPITLSVLDRFIVDGTRLRVLAEALDEAGNPIAFSFAWAAWDENKTKTHGNSDVTLGPWSTAFRTFDVALTHPPAGATSARGLLSIFSKDEDRFDQSPRRTDLPGTLSFPVAPPLGSEAQLRLEVATGSSSERLFLLRRDESLAPKTTLDLGELLAPRIEAARVEPTEARARPALRWKIDGDPQRVSAMDALIVRAAWPSTREHVWTVVMPPTASAPFRLPELPPELATWAPDDRPMTIAAALVEASFYDGYAGVRRKGIMLLHEPPEDEAGSTLLRWSVTGDLEF